MKELITIFLALLILGSGGTPSADGGRDVQIYDNLRSMVLNLKARDIGVSKDSFPHPVYALLVETGFPEGSFTLSVIADGSTSLYFSNGGGIIGGGEHERVRKASVRLLSGAQYFHGEARSVAVFPKPDIGVVSFYFITFDGVRSYAAREEDLGNGSDRLSKLFFAAHDVIRELREIEESAQGR